MAPKPWQFVEAAKLLTKTQRILQYNHVLVNPKIFCPTRTLMRMSDPYVIPHSNLGSVRDIEERGKHYKMGGRFQLS